MRTLIAFAFLFVSACASIPKESYLLSEELGNKISSLEKSHINLLHVYFEQKRNLVDEFLNKVWLPEFAEQFFMTPEIEEAWAEIVKANDTVDRLEFLIAVGPELQLLINEKRQELVKPLNDIEQELELRIREEFNLARSANNTLTSFLISASKVNENQNRYLNMINITEDKISEVISETDVILEDLINKSEGVMRKEADLAKYSAYAETYLEEIKTLKDKLRK